MKNEERKTEYEHKMSERSNIRSNIERWNSNCRSIRYFQQHQPKKKTYWNLYARHTKHKILETNSKGNKDENSVSNNFLKISIDFVFTQDDPDSASIKVPNKSERTNEREIKQAIYKPSSHFLLKLIFGYFIFLCSFIRFFSTFFFYCLSLLHCCLTYSRSLFLCLFFSFFVSNKLITEGMDRFRWTEPSGSA